MEGFDLASASPIVYPSPHRRIKEVWCATYLPGMKVEHRPRFEDFDKTTMFESPACRNSSRSQRSYFSDVSASSVRLQDAQLGPPRRWRCGLHHGGSRSRRLLAIDRMAKFPRERGQTLHVCVCVCLLENADFSFSGAGNRSRFARVTAEAPYEWNTTRKAAISFKVHFCGIITIISPVRSTYANWLSREFTRAGHLSLSLSMVLRWADLLSISLFFPLQTTYPN